MSSMSISSRRQIWSKRNPLRKQQSLVDSSGYTTSAVASSSTNLSVIANNHLLRSTAAAAAASAVERRQFLQKQFSVDAVLNNRHNRSLTRQGHCQGHLSGRSLSEIKSNFLNFQKINNKRVNSGNQLTKPNVSLGIAGVEGTAAQRPIGISITASENSSCIGNKKKSQLQVNRNYGCEHKRERNTVNNDRITKKPSRTGDDKVNLNIFLDHHGSISVDCNDSCSEIDSASESLEAIQLNQSENLLKNNPTPTLTEESIVTKQTEVSSSVSTTTKSSSLLVKSQAPQQLSAASRRAQFQANRDHFNNQSISASPSLTISSRPPLVRAMSAPIRSFDENNKNIFTNKRKSRRRKVCTQKSQQSTKPALDRNICNGDDCVSNNNVNNGNNLINEIDEQKTTKPVNRPRCTVGCDVVTLVSLISSEGSDSEKEEIPTPKTEKPIFRRAPPLRKTGKSVSFQENDLINFPSSPITTPSSKEFPHMLRRASVAPLAARIRANRPPTAPPVSIFISDFENNYTKMSEKVKSSSKEELSFTKQANQQNLKTDVNASNNDNDYPDYVRSLKERECWKLFQKMCNKGVCVTYDTILRGMLTPTELRQLQKQREYEEAQKIKFEAAVVAAAAAEQAINEKLKK